MLSYIDIHTHTINGVCNYTDAVYSIVNTYEKFDIPFSYGIHPYDVDKYEIEQFELKIEELEGNELFMAIGEIGLDYRFENSIHQQLNVFKDQLHIANTIHKPVVLHIVKSLPQTLQIIKKECYKHPFIVHNFRGNINQAYSIINAGGFISISPKTPKETPGLWEIFSDYIFLETDATEMDIREHYKNFANTCNISVNTLLTKISKNFKQIFNYELG